MKCFVLLVNRTQGKFYWKAEYNANSGIIHKGLGKGTEGFYIPDKALTINIEKGKTGSIPIWIVNERTGTALSLFEGDMKETINSIDPDNYQPTTETHEATKPISNLKPVYEKRPKEKGVGGLISFVEKSDPATKLKLNVLTKQAFWEMLAKQLKMGFLRTLIYLCAGGGIFLIGLYVIKIIFLKESSI